MCSLLHVIGAHTLGGVGEKAFLCWVCMLSPFPQGIDWKFGYKIGGENIFNKNKKQWLWTGLLGLLGVTSINTATDVVIDMRKAAEPYWKNKQTL